MTPRFKYPLQRTYPIMWLPARMIFPQMVFWVALTIWSFFPNRLNVFLLFGGVPVNFKEVILLVMCLIYGVFNLKRLLHGLTVGYSWDKRLPLLVIAILIYAWVSTCWGNLEDVNLKPMLYNLIITGSSFFLGYLIVISMKPHNLSHFLERLSLFIAFVAAIYAIDTFLSIGFRSNLDMADLDFGISRARGPLYYVSTAGFVLLPAIGYLLYYNFERMSSRIMIWVVLWLIVFGLLATGSRAAAGSLLVASFLGFILYKKTIRGLLTAGVFLLMIISVVGLLTSRADFERFSKSLALGRIATYALGLKVLSDGGPELVVGHGYGSIWAWRDVSMEQVGTWKGNLIDTEYGESLYHPHSDLLQLVVHLGLFGLIFFLRVWGIVLVACWKTKRQPLVFLAAALVATLILVNFETYFFMRHVLTAIWCIYLFGLLKLIKENEGNFYAPRTKKSISKTRLIHRPLDLNAGETSS